MHFVDTYNIWRDNISVYKVYIPTTQKESPFIVPATSERIGGFLVYIYKQFAVKLWDENESNVAFLLTLKTPHGSFSNEVWIPRGVSYSTVRGIFYKAQLALAIAAMIKEE